MNPQEALILGRAIVAAAEQAIADGRHEIDLLELGQNIDDKARAALAAAIERASQQG